MSVYLDASVLVSLFTGDTFTQRADGFLRKGGIAVVVSDFAAAEVASAIARQVRVGRLDAREARVAFSQFDDWTARSASRVETATVDIAAAADFVRRLELNLRTADAINIAIARRLGVELATFDERMRENARALGAALAAV